MLDYYSDKKKYELNAEFLKLHYQDILTKIERSKNNSFITINNDIDLVFDNSKPLSGLLLAVKDNITTRDIKTTAGSKMLENYIPNFNATVVERLFNAGVSIIGKTNLDEFAVGSRGDLSYFGDTFNAIDKTFVSGGSSSGSAVVVAEGLCHASLGSDTGGSVRLPAAYNRVFGFKPTFGALSRYGLIAHCSSFDTIGILSPNIDLIKEILDASSGYDENDLTSIDLNENINYDKKNKIAIPNQKLLNKCSEDIQNEFIKTIDILKKNGYKIDEIDLKYSELWLPVYYIISTAEFSSNMARYDGIRYGYRANTESKNMTARTRTDAFGKEVIRRILSGTFVLSKGYSDKYYKKALKAANLIKDEFSNMFEEYDFFLMPTSASTAPKIGEEHDIISNYKNDELNIPANIAGLPSLNIPYKNKNILSGFQVISKKQNDLQVLEFAKYITSILY